MISDQMSATEFRRALSCKCGPVFVVGSSIELIPTSIVHSFASRFRYIMRYLWKLIEMYSSISHHIINLAEDCTLNMEKCLKLCVQFITVVFRRMKALTGPFCKKASNLQVEQSFSDFKIWSSQSGHRIIHNYPWSSANCKNPKNIAKQIDRN